MFKKKQLSKNVCLLYFLIPLLINSFIEFTGNEDIWYILNYGKTILKNGFFHTDYITLHQGLHVVVQQPFSCIIFYVIYKFFGSYGFFLLTEIMLVLILYLLYKLCMILSDNKPSLSVLLSCTTVILLQHGFITCRPQIFTYAILITELYILEKFIKNSSTKSLYLLPILSIVQINLHGAFWYMLFIFMLPYIVELIINKNKSIYKLIGIMILMFLVGIINPYGIENMFFIFKSYGNLEMNNYILELRSINITDNSVVYASRLFYIVLSIILLIYIYHKKGALKLRHLFLLGGTSLLALINIRNMSLFYIGSIPFLASYIKDLFPNDPNRYVNTKKVWIVFLIIILCLSLIKKERLNPRVEDGGKYLVDNYSKKDVVLYNELDFGSYLGYIGFKPYIDTRAEVFLKKSNGKKDILHEKILVETGKIDYNKFINKYNFTHFIVYNNDCFYNYLKNNNDYKVVFKKKNYSIFIRNKV